ncbi:MAG: D-2-hydroxyacid dehydrogenase [Prevotella sp.]|nr:D-2-hydroxyacid dehydrogenase [Prevotella sp.]MCI5854397.1 D-2-hydroxyacid dehydrogenase [Prevotella sp.]MDD6738073.1 D-2-hydroxyacid dehydrogenase [Prevotella sp.]MDY6091669.1 D-2-hydroxyacid dehydrogenase [Prevotella sp.]
MKIVILDGICVNPGDLSWEDMSKLGELTIYERTAPQQVVERCVGAEAVITNKVMITDEVMAALPQLKYVGILATGYNVVDIDAAHRRGITVTNIPAYSTDSVAQMTFAHILNITNRVEHYAMEVREGKWSAHPDFCYWNTPLPELAGKTLGIVGLGNTGMRVACIAHAFGMDVFAMTSKNAADLPEGIQKTTLQGLLATSDILSLHCPLNDETFHLINAQTIAMMKRGAILINTGRGPLVDEEAVAKALDEGQLMAYGADVMAQEPPQKNHPLFSHPHAFLTPHIAWATREARERLMVIAANNLKAFAEGEKLNVL